MSRSTGQSVEGPATRWAALGTGSAIVLDRVELHEVELPFVEPVRTAVGTHRVRPLVLVHVIGHSPGGGQVDGWGECAALADTTYDTEDAAIAFSSLQQELVPGLLGAAADGIVPPVGELTDILDGARRPLAFAALEMAVGDLHLRGVGRSFADLLGVTGRWVVPGAVLGLPRSADQLARDLDRLRAAGFARVKIKVSPGDEAVIVQALRPLVGSGLLVQLDANGAFGEDAAARLATLDGLGLACIEQPLARDDLQGHRRLARSIATPICLDESLDGPAAVVETVTSGACSVVCVKPSRLGGIGAALDVVAWCGTNGVTWWMGGMFESGFARGVNRTIAALSGPSLPGDLSPPETYLSADLVPPVTGRLDAGTGHLVLPVPNAPGLGPAPDAALLDHATTRGVVVSAVRP